ncbi:septum site-determining protein MinC [Bombilactobacillus thymidiniphilus]|uniref:Probable septum site-determining protein MinC n=1 Tax=Bombilactobacillus thymidiniphilus TaxID=2923363 RepID=A0ABY4PDG2_9LACO|nr:septum site-determining protein MinC [Bombilactobacillus thymidiniphilus]UQS83823.1 septum formation initiator [Bombilactobacillus thymidiniphilus]
MMKNVALKGKGQEYYLEISSYCDFNAALEDMKVLFDDLAKSTDKLTLIVDTQQRLLGEKQITELKQLIKSYHMLDLKQIVSAVDTKTSLNNILKKNQIQIESHIVRSGQILDYNGNLLLLGDVHAGAQVRATGSIFVVGVVEGIIHAGFPDNDDAVIAGNLGAARQIRISDLFQIVADLAMDNLEMDSFFYVNDLHTIAIDKIDNLATIKPQKEIIIS